MHDLMDGSAFDKAEHRKHARKNENPKAKPRKPHDLRGFSILAERVGFEPTVRENRTPDFESGTFDHSATSPSTNRARYFTRFDRPSLSGSLLNEERKYIEPFRAFQAPF